MNSNQIFTRIILPTLTLFENHVNCVTIHSTIGVFSVLPKHMNLISNISSNIVEITDNNKKSSYYIDTAIVQITDTTLSILANFAMNLETTDKKEISNHIDSFQQELSTTEPNALEHRLIVKNIDKYQSLLNFL